MVATKIESGANLFFFPGVARSRICRQGVKYDKFVSSILFLTHFLPDAPKFSQMNSLCSLMLGPNGIWGKLTDLSEDDIEIFNETLQKYKRVRDSINESYPKTKGFIGSSPEIHEKINYDKSEGLICFFTASKGTFTHITDTIDTSKFISVDGADSWEITSSCRLKITVTLEENQARPVFVYSSDGKAF
jgi:alpha-galactosidase